VSLYFNDGTPWLNAALPAIAVLQDDDTPLPVRNIVKQEHTMKN
jgi:hypothetical protein